mgnify:CR=1 FL=1
MAKRSAEIAGNASRSANEGSRAFLASTRNSGGITLNGGEVSTGQGATSSDYGDASGALRGLNTKMDNLMDAEQEFKDARKSLRKNFWARLTRNAISALVSSEELYDALAGKTSEQISITAVSIIDATRFNYKIPLEKN